MRLGAPVFVETDEPQELAKAHKAEGYRAAYCPKVTLNEPERIHEIEKAFADEGVVIAEVGAWGNMIAPDPQKRQAQIDVVCERLALADEVGALGCVDYAGTYDPNSSTDPHPKNLSDECFDLIVETIRHIIDSVKPKRARFMLEMMPAVHPHSPDSYAALLKAVDSPAFGVHLDPVNIITSPERYFYNGKVIQACFEKLGHAIVSCHGKDIMMYPTFMVEIRECRPGTGTLDYRTFLTELNRLPGDVPLMMEHLPNKEEYDLAKGYITGVAAELGLSF
ncbi:MAG: sugar phosphate isomerase/epimerase [Candidatus Poribacteria bacterium]|nr:sugar phosphate isomerase/epimerase [Candidatus Poribacteria bacterium]